MGSGGSDPDDVFDVRRVRRLLELMQEFELAEVDLRQADQRIRLCKSHAPTMAAVSLPAASAPLPSNPAATGAAAPAAPAAAAGEGRFVTSPMVGTFYASASPDAAPFVKVGDQVGPDSVVCIIEAMKVFNEVPADVSGKIVAVLVENGAAVEFGQRLFRIE